MSFLAFWFLILTFALFCCREEAAEIVASIVGRFRK